MTTSVDPRLLEGVRLFNRREFFAAHDVLEDLWGESLGADRTFYQGLIHAAVAVHHFGEGNLTGARKMYESARRYLSPYAAVHQGVLVGELLDRLRDCFAELLAVNGRYPHGVMLSPDRIPTIALQPEVPT